MHPRYFILFIILMLAGAAGAQIDPGPDGVGIYADKDGMVNEVEIEAGVPLEVYLLLTRPSAQNMLGGWECGLVVPDNVTIWGWNISTPGALSLSEPPNFMVGHPYIPYQTVNLLMTFIIVPLDSEPAQFYIRNSELPASADYPRYVDDASLGHGDGTVEMIPYPGGEGVASFVINGEAVAATSATWGDMKALFR